MSEPIAPIPGVNGHFVLNSGVLDTPTWNDMLNIRDVDSEITFDEADITARFGAGFKMFEPTLAAIAFSTQHMYNPADAQLMGLRNNVYRRQAVDCAIMDGPITETGSQGWRMRVKGFKAPRKEPLDGIMSMEFDWKLCFSTLPPSYLVVGSDPIVGLG